MPRPLPRLIVADSERDPDMLYATRFFAPDPFVFLSHRGKSTVLLSDLEIDRGRRDAQVDEVLALSDLAKRAPSKKNATFAEQIALFLRSRRIKRVSVPHNFALGLGQELAAEGIQTVAQSGLFFPEREYKTPAELRVLRRALEVTEAGMARGIEVLRASQIPKNKVLRWNSRPLTSEILRAEIESAILRAGGVPANTIVAGGEQACDPHERGTGPLKADTLLILDIFPQLSGAGYFGDMTRTVVRGRASEAQRQLWHTVLEGQKLALKTMKPGADGRGIQDAVKNLFTERGYPTEQRKGRWCGFFHGLGHGLGLELHESPRMSATILKPGQVITVEPGLYYPGLGGVRHEDVVTVTEKGIRMLSRFPKPLEV